LTSFKKLLILVESNMWFRASLHCPEPANGGSVLSGGSPKMTIRTLLALAVLPLAFAACGGSQPAAEAPKADASAAPSADAAPAADAPAAADGADKKDDAAPAADKKEEK
jgi:hypothetical protein